MSSHHIIRENQEPALVILSEIRSEILNQLLEWSPKVFCHYSLLDWIIESGFKIDVILGPEEYRDESLVKMEFQMPVDFISFNNDWLNLLTGIQNHTIHFSSNKELNLFNLKIDKEIVRYSDDFKEFRIKGEWKKWKNKGDELQLSEQPDEMLNLEKNDFKYLVKNDGMVKISSTRNLIIKEFFVL